VALFVPLSDTHTGEVGVWDIPHGLTSVASVTSAKPGKSDTKLWVAKPPS